MSLERAFTALLALALACGTLRAEAQESERPVVLVMESSLGVGGASKVRALLRQRLGITIFSASEAGTARRPSAMLAVALDRGQMVTVVYVDERGQSETLSAPVVGAAADVTAVVATLAGALLQKHFNAPAQVEGPPGGAARGRAQARDANAELVNASRALYAALGRIGGLPRRTGRLSPEDF